MSAPIPRRSLDARKFSACADELYVKFELLGEMSRQTFRNVCRQNAVNPAHMQAYYESAGMVVHKQRASGATSNSDRFEWSPNAYTG